MESLIATANWQEPKQACRTLNFLLSKPIHTDTIHTSGFACASSLKTETADIFSSQLGDYVICDARIDNRKDILQSLNQPSSNSDTLSDAEIIFATYKQWGEAAAEKLIGDFSFVIWDEEQKKIYAARDPMNMRTLYYCKLGAQLCFSSDVATLIKHPQYKVAVNKMALAAWISARPDPDASLFKGIECLPAGHFISACATTFIIKQFWDLDPGFELRYRHAHDYEEHLSNLLQQCVTDRLASGDSLVASQMSGGMDSTSVTALARRTLLEQNRKLMVISHSYADTENCNETALINTTAAHLGLDNIHWLAAEQRLNLSFPALYPPALENPGTVLSPRYEDEMKLMQAHGARVLLTGSGGDEMCWGHSLTYCQRLKRGNFAVIPEVIRGCRVLDLPVIHTLLNLFAKPLIPAVAKDSLKTLFSKHKSSALPPWAQTPVCEQYIHQTACLDSNNARFNNPALQARYIALRYTSTLNAVRSYHRVAARFGIDVRHPFFDRRLAEFSFAIPDDLWIRNNHPKWLLRRAMDQHLPASVCWNKKKIIFDTFFGNLLRSQADTIRHILSDTRLQDMGLLNVERLLAAFELSISKPQASLNVDLLYALLSQIWFQKYAHLFSH